VSIYSLCRAIQSGYQPPSKREEVFVALLLATAMLEHGSSAEVAHFETRDAMVQFSFGRRLLALAQRFASAVQENGWSDRQSVIESINACLKTAFEYTGDRIDLAKDLIDVDQHEPELDKYPEWLSGAPVSFKREVGRVMSREGVPDGCTWKFCAVDHDMTCVEFETCEGETLGPWQLDFAYPFLRDSSTLAMVEINRRNRERLVRQLSPGSEMHPNISPQMPPFGNMHRHYMPGLGRFLTEVRLQEQQRGEHQYAYAMNNPTTYTDPSGLYPKVICPSNPGREKELINAVNKVCAALVGAGVPGLLASKCLNRPGQEQCMVDWCNHSKSTVRCGNLTWCRKICPDAPKGCCAYTGGAKGPGNAVYVCPEAWDNPNCQKWPCSSLVGNILHEIASLCGTPHEGGGDKFPDLCDFRADCLCKNISGLA
jgi:RHS repeat-associated protein